MRRMISEQEIEQNKQTIITLLKSTAREGIDAVIRYLHTSGFFTIPSSTDRHHNWPGGLAEHSLGVYNEASTSHKELPHDSLVIACLLHDLCKARQLIYDRNGRVHRNRHIHIHGHGYRSMKLIEMLGLQITEDERRAIRWHMGGHHSQPSDAADLALARQSILAQAVKEADHADARKHPCII